MSDRIDLYYDKIRKKFVIYKFMKDTKTFKKENGVYEQLSQIEGYSDLFLAYNKEFTDLKEQKLCVDFGDIDLK